MTHGGNVWQGAGPETWLDFSANIRAGGAPDWVKASLDAGMERIGYYPDLNALAAKRGLAEALGLPMECVLPTAGGIEAIELAARGIRDDVLIFDPAFSEYERVSKQRAANIQRASLLSAGYCFGTLLSLASPYLSRGVTVWLNNPNNPIGSSFDRSEVSALLSSVEKVNGRLIVDEAFIGYCPEHSVADLVKDHPALIVVGSLTKTLGIPGVRLGYLLAHPDICSQLTQRALPWSLNCFATEVAAEYPRHLTVCVEDALDNARRRSEMIRRLKALGAFVYPSRSNFVLAALATPVNAIIRKLRRQNILVRQCADFHGIDDGYHLRLAVKTTAENEILLQALEAALI